MAVTGGSLGAVNAASQPGTLQQRAQAADNAFLPGAAAGVAFPAAIGVGGAALRTTGNALRAVGAVGSEAVDAASRAMTGKTIVDQARPIPANVALAGQSNALGTLRSLGATPEGLLAAQQAAGGKPITTAEALGPQGVSQASGLIRRAGTAAQTADATMAARAADRGNRILGDIHATTGVDPEAAKGNVDAIVQAGRAKADPLFEAIRSRAEPISHPGLSQILSRPVVAKAVGAASDDLLNAGIDPQAHGFVMGSPIARGPDPLPTPGPGDVARALADVKEVRTTPTGGLFRAMQELGGVKVKTADGSSVAGPDVLGALNGVRAPGLINNQAGMSPENMAQALHDRGFFGENVADPSSAFADALAEHARGNPVFKPGTAAADAAQRAQGLDQEMQTAGVLASDRPAVAAQKLATHRFGDTQESAAIQDEGGPGDAYGAMFDQLSAPRIQVSGLTPHALDLVRQNLGDMVERDPFGKVIPDTISRGNFNINQAKGALTDLLAGDGTPDNPGLIPGYREALDTSGDYMSVKGAYDRTQGRLFGTQGAANDPRAFDTFFKGLGPAEQDASRASLANDIFMRLQNGQLRPGSFDAPAVQSKLQSAFGPAADDLIGRMKVEADMSKASARMTPNLNSTTGDVIGSTDRGDVNAALAGAKLAGNAMTGNVGGAARAAGSMLLPFVSAARQPMNMATRNAFGDMLYQPPEVTAQALAPNAFSSGPPAPSGRPPGSISALSNAFAILAANRQQSGLDGSSTGP